MGGGGGGPGLHHPRSEPFLPGPAVRPASLPPAQRAELLDGVRIDPRGRQTYGLGLQSRLLSCGVRTWEHSGGLHGSLTWTVSTADGGRQLTFNVNGDWLEREEPVVAVLETVFCPGGSRA